MRLESVVSTATLLAALVAVATVRAAPRDGTVLASSPYRLAPWDSLAKADRFLERAVYERARSDRGLELRRVTYASDGIPVTAIVALPRPLPPRRLPVVVFCRGGYVVGDVGWQQAAFLHHLVRSGFVVVAPMLRGSDGAGGHDAMGGEDLDDVFNAVPLAHALGVGDTSRVFLAGESRGGAMAYMALRRGFPARAAAVWGAFTDLDSLMSGDPAVYDKVRPVVWPDWAARGAQIGESRSAARWGAEIRRPLLILHGGADGGVPLRQPLRLAAALEEAGRTYRLVVMGGEGHILRGATVERDSLVARWFRANP